MTNSTHPCASGLSAACFASHPTWAKQMFSWRLLTTLAPPALSRRLQKMLGIKAVFPGVIIPPGVVLPPGAVVPPGVVIPPDWTSRDMLPAGVWVPATSWEFPPGWKPWSTPPPGVDIPLYTIWPDGWKVGDPLPDGVTLAEGFYYPPFSTPANLLPPGTYVPAGTDFPTGWAYGDSLPAGIILPDGFEYGQPFAPDISLPYSFNVSPGTVFPPGWEYGDALPSGVALPPGVVYGYPGASGSPSNFEAFPPGRPNPAGAVSPPAAGSFSACFDNTYWKNNPAFMTETIFYSGPPPYWASVGPESGIIVNGTWNVGFRPTKVRITDNAPGTRLFWLKDTDDDNLAYYSGTDNPIELNLSFSSGLDIASLTWLAPYHLLNLEFFS